MKNKTKEIAEAIYKKAEEWRELAWAKMSEEKSATGKRKAAADWNRAIAISAKASEVIERERETQEVIEM